MSKTIVFRFATPDPIKYEVKGVGKNAKPTVKRRNWNGEKLFAYLQEQLPEAFAGRFPGLGLKLEHATRPDIRLEGWKPDKTTEDELKENLADLVGEIMGDIEVEEYLLS